MRQVLAVAAVLLWVGGCATAESVRGAQGQGVKRTFRQPYDAVYSAVVSAASKRNLEVIEKDRASGRILLSSGASWTSLGEYIAVFVSRAGNRTTTVEVVSRPVLSTVTFPPNWPNLLFGDVEHELAAGRAQR